jgi:hypothetical protein
MEQPQPEEAMPPIASKDETTPMNLDLSQTETVAEPVNPTNEVAAVLPTPEVPSIEQVAPDMPEAENGQNTTNTPPSETPSDQIHGVG